MESATCTAPLVSVCMPCYNAAFYLSECMDSILAQSFSDFELLIVDDGSTDNSIEIIKKYTDSRIRLLRNDHDFIGALNLLLTEAKGKYIARMDADDIMMPDRLLTQFNYMEYHRETDILGSGMEIFGVRKGFFLPHVTSSSLSYADFTARNALAHPTVFIRRASFQAKGLHYRSDYIYAEDYKLWVDALQAGLCLDNLATLLLRYRTSPRQNSIKYDLRQKKTTRQIQNEVKRIMEKQQNESYETA